MRVRHRLVPGSAVLVAAALMVVSVVSSPSRTAAAGTQPAAGAPAAGTRVVGTQILRRCGPAWCGRLQVPLDWSVPSGPTISVAYQWYPASNTSGPAEGTVVPVEGGPGYPSTGSVEYGAAGGYWAMYGPVLERRNLLAVDLRGTGSSSVLNCPALQVWPGSTGGRGFQLAAGACAARVNDQYGTGSDSPFLASSVFSSAPAAYDLAAVIRALDAGPVDLYGDSYGSFFAQTFAARFPSLVRSVILDSTYQVQDLDPWYVSSVVAFRQDFATVCQRSPVCASLGVGGWDEIVALADRLRAHPASGTVPGGNGRVTQVTMNVVGLVNIVNDAAEDPVVYRELDGAAHSLLVHGDPSALLRLYAERFVYDEDYFDTPASAYSGGLYLADSCIDYPQLFNLDEPTAVRRQQLQQAIAALPASTFAPFTTTEWLAMDQNTENYTACLDWPAPKGAELPVTASPPFLPPSMPVLILGGQLDGWTPPAGLPAVEQQLGGNSRVIIMANSTHVVGEGDRFGCATSLIRQFVVDPSALGQLNASCASKIPAIHAVGDYPDNLGQQPPLQLRGRPGPGEPGPTLEQRRLASAAVDTAGDAIARWAATAASPDLGLHGGSTQASDDGQQLRLHGDELIPGVAVSGTVTLSGDDRRATATLSAQAPDGSTVLLRATWAIYGEGALAQVQARAGSLSFSGTTAAP